MTRQDLEIERQRRLRAAQRVVIKLGTSVVTGEGGEVCGERIEALVRSIYVLNQANRQVVLVSSGAVGLGAGRLGLHPSRLKDVVVRQACAAVGQSLLMHAYEKLFRVHDVKIAQVLLTEDDFTDFRRYTNLRRTMEKLLKSASCLSSMRTIRFRPRSSNTIKVWQPAVRSASLATMIALPHW